MRRLRALRTVNSSREAGAARAPQKRVGGAEGWGVVHCGKLLSSFGQRTISSGRAKGDQTASLAEQSVSELWDIAELAPPLGHLGVCGRRARVVTRHWSAKHRHHS